jgi:hypothetical protein
LPVQIGIDVANVSLQGPGISSQQNYLAAQLSLSLLQARQHALGSEHAGWLVAVNAPKD